MPRLGGMVRRALVAALLLLAAAPAAAQHEDDPLITSARIRELEWRSGGDLIWDVETWIGRDIHKLWVRTDGRAFGGADAVGDLEVLLGRAVSAYWDLVAGWRGDSHEGQRNYAALGVRGLAPGFVEAEVTGFAGVGGRVGMRLDLEQEWFLSRRWLILPEVDFHAFRGDGPAFAEFDAGLRIEYAIRHEAAPYLGVRWSRRFGEDAGSGAQLVAGFAILF